MLKSRPAAILLSLSLLFLPACGQQAGGGAFSLTLGSAPYSCGAEVAPVLETLGDGYEYAEGLNCAYDSVDKTFTYPALTIYTVPLEQGDVISELYTEDPSVATSEGVTVGAARAEVTAAHGDGYEDLGNLLVYRAEDRRAALCFEMDAGAVIAIFVTTEAI